MSDDNPTYKKVDIIGTSPDSVSDAISNALDRAAETVEELDWFEVNEIRGRIEDEEPLYQVDLEVGFRLK